MWTDLFSALALVLVLEGILPFINPVGMKKMFITAAQLNDRSMRMTGLVSMVAGLLLLYYVR